MKTALIVVATVLFAVAATLALLDSSALYPVLVAFGLASWAGSGLVG
jgi:hypothetical protein